MTPKSKTPDEKPVTQTVKLEQEVFVRLTTFSAKTRRTNQDILRTTLIQYLTKNKS